jgi:transposase-like protein
MRTRFTQAYKIQAVEKALARCETINLAEIAESLGVGYSTLQKWIAQSRKQEFESIPRDELSSLTNMIKEKRPQDWSLEERLNIIIACGLLDEKAASELCRKQGVYPHHVEQWKLDFVSKNRLNNKVKAQTEVKTLKNENQALKKELKRKDKALAETAALLVLQKKVSAIWGNDEDNFR